MIKHTIGAATAPAGAAVLGEVRLIPETTPLYENGGKPVIFVKNAGFI